jgi:hypothetical protein
MQGDANYYVRDIYVHVHDHGHVHFKLEGRQICLRGTMIATTHYIVGDQAKGKFDKLMKSFP